MNRSKPLVLLVVLLCLSLQAPVHGESRASSKASAKTAESKATSTELKGSKQLVNNDNLIPTQNRTQATAVEATTGHLPDGEDATLAEVNAAAKKKKKTASKSKKHSVRTQTEQSLSHAAIRRGVSAAARGR